MNRVQYYIWLEEQSDSLVCYLRKNHNVQNASNINKAYKAYAIDDIWQIDVVAHFAPDERSYIYIYRKSGDRITLSRIIQIGEKMWKLNVASFVWNVYR